MVTRLFTLLLLLTVVQLPLMAQADKEVVASKAVPTVVPAAVLKFQQRGSKDDALSAQVTDLLFANLAMQPELWLVERDELAKIVAEQELNLSGAVNSGQAIQVGQLTGAKVLITGSVLKVEKTTYIVAKLIGTETSRVLGASVKGGPSDKIDTLAEKLATQIGQTIKNRSGQLLAKPTLAKDRIASVNKALGKSKRPRLWIEVKERHIGRSTTDPAAQTELMKIAKGTGFVVLDPETAAKSDADIVITGEGFSEFAKRLGNLVTVKSRVEVQAVDQSGKLLAIDRQTSRKVDLAEQLAGKAALQECSARIAERLLVNMVKSPGKFVGRGKKKKKKAGSKKQ